MRFKNIELEKCVLCVVPIFKIKFVFGNTLLFYTLYRPCFEVVQILNKSRKMEETGLYYHTMIQIHKTFLVRQYYN